jgi:hypothetical protein
MSQYRKDVTADIIHERKRNGMTGLIQDCVRAVCQESGHKTDPVWGSNTSSIRRALATLTEECSCGATWHMEEE